MCPVMVGRGDELRRLCALLEPAADPRVALIRGEAGVGKTRLMQEMLARLPDGARAFVGQAEQGMPGRPYQLLAEAVEPYLGDIEDVPADPDALRILVRPGSADDVELPAEALLRAAVDLIRHLVGAGPAVVVFEDLHWADAQSLTLFRRLASVAGLPIVLVGTYRTEGLGRALLTEVLGAVERRRVVEHVDLDRLDLVGVADLLNAVYGAVVPRTVAAALHERTGGNPFHLEELLAAAGEAPPEALPTLSLPADVTEAVLRHLDGLDDEQRGVVDAAAVLGHRISFDLLSAVTGLSENGLIVVLRALLGRGLVVEEDVDVFSFRHALTREAVAGRLLGRERRRLHEKAFACLRESGSEDWSALARHAAGAGRPDEIVAAARAGAAHYLRTGSVLEAVRLTELALAEADEDAELLELATRAAWSAALRERAIDRGERWRKLAAARGDDERLSRALRTLARLRWETGDAPAQRRIAEEALVVGERLGPGPEKAWVYALLSEVHLLSGDGAEAVRWAETGLEMDERATGAAARAALLCNKGSAMMTLGPFDEGVRLLREAVDRAEACGDPLTCMRALNNLVVDGYLRLPPADTFALIDRMSTVVDRSGWYGRRGQVESLRSIVLLDVEGDLVGAAARLRALRPDEQLGDVPASLVFLVLDRALFALEAGDLDEADRLVEQAASQDLSSSDAEGWGVVHRLHLELELAARRGQRDRLGELLGRLDGAVARITDPEAWFRGLLTAVRGGVDAAVARELRERHHQPERPVGGATAAWNEHIDGVLAERDGDLAAAVDAYRRALALPEPRRGVVQIVDVHSGLARCLLALDRQADARKHAETAVAMLDRWPGWRRAEAETLLRRLGGGPAVSGPDALTPREREVAALISEGLSNAELGRRLYISPKTASVHVSNILTKLGMSSRVEVAAWAIRESLSR